VRCWDPEGNRVVFDLEGGHTKSVDTVIAYRSSASGTTRLLTASCEGRAKVWETVGDSGALVLTLEDGLRTDDQDNEHRIRLACVFYGPTGSDRMAIGHVSGTIRVWDGEVVRDDE
jgi:WD40 repeat protein